LFAIQCRLKALFNEALLDVIDCVEVTVKLFRNVFIAVFGFTVTCINSEQYVGVFHFTGAALYLPLKTIAYNNCRSSSVSVTLYFLTIETSV
jgi:hypothetical protein